MFMAFQVVGAVASLMGAAVSVFVGARTLREYRRRTGDDSTLGRVLSGDFRGHHREAA